MTKPSPVAPQGRRPGLAAQATARFVARLQAQYRRDNPAAVAALARLRRGAGRPAHDSPHGWGVDGLEHLAELTYAAQAATAPDGAAPFPSSNTPRGETVARRQEEAVHLAVTLWALHQQSIRDADMHRHGYSLGSAVRYLALGRTGAEQGAPPSQREDADEQVNETIRKRFVRIGTSTSFESLSTRLRDMVVLLRNARVPLDYGRLADQLYRWQKDAWQADVRRAWGREFHLAAAPRGPRQQPDEDHDSGSDGGHPPRDPGE
ncbi:type I-E CRISPR-associated protein Cse2/CasB [Streptomyces sp. XM4011]|uniref:type I-E CRISPR-associated protein Cse2/CasB n=1 Tax=Streptomyces sp. XM4011 TaxID=2929780 RepID=UPI001FF74201|nr:type I-E CRISPR-associated protein Cse2/CasB [Streptomyces sp. XM4011]MCK1816238.1 type I-E CRISPR-associated protein Cse2/CasB [Streptomyces sp. XM4011]